MPEPIQGLPNQLPEPIVVDPPVGSPVLKTSTACAAHLAIKAEERRKARAKQIVEGKQNSRLPNAVEIEVDVAALLNERFLAAALFELRERPGIVVSGDDSHSFEAMPVETLRTEADDFFDSLKAEIDNTDASKQVLAFSSKPIVLLGADGKTKEAYHLVRLAKVRAHIERTGIPLELPKSAAPVEESEA